MEATITLRAAPAEFDLIREALRALAHALSETANDGQHDPALRRKVRADLLRVEALQGRLQ